MSSPGTLSAALAFVPKLVARTTDPGAFDSLLLGLARACGWRSCGFVWIGDGGPVVKTVQAGTRGGCSLAAGSARCVAPAEAWRNNIFYSLPKHGGSRVRGPFNGGPHPRFAVGGENCRATVDRRGAAYLVLIARTMERSPALSVVVGPVIDPDRLYQRLGDAAVIAGRLGHDFEQPAARHHRVFGLDAGRWFRPARKPRISSRRSAKSVSAAFSSRNSFTT